MKIKKNFLHTKSHLPPIPRWKIMVGIILGLFFTFVFYNFLYLMREGMRVQVFPFDNNDVIKIPVLILPDHIVWRHNLFFAFVSAIFGQSLCFLYWFNIPTKPASKNYLKVKMIVNELQYLNLNFISWFTRLAYCFSIIVGATWMFTAYEPEAFGKFDYLLFLFLPVLFLHIWMTLRRTIKHSFRKLLLSLFIIFVIAFSLANYHPIDYKKINELSLSNSLWSAYRIELPESEFDEYVGSVGWRRATFMMVQEKDSKVNDSPLLFANFINEYELLSTDTAANIASYWNKYRNLIRDPFNMYVAYVDKDITMKDIIQFKKEILKAGTFFLRFGVVPFTRIYSKNSYKYQGIGCRIPSCYNEPDARDILLNEITWTDRIWEINHISSSLLSINGEEVEMMDLKKRIREFVEYNPEYFIIYYENENLIFSDYIAVTGKIRRVIEDLRDEYVQRKYGKRMEELYGEIEEDIRKIYPYNLVSIPGNHISSKN